MTDKNGGQSLLVTKITKVVCDFIEGGGRFSAASIALAVSLTALVGAPVKGVKKNKDEVRSYCIALIDSVLDNDCGNTARLKEREKE